MIIFNLEQKKEGKKVKDVEHNYLGYAVHWPTGIPVTDQHTEIEMGAEERGMKGVAEQTKGWRQVEGLMRKWSKG